MTIKTIPIQFNLLAPSGAPAAGAQVIARLINAATGAPSFDTDGSDGAAVPIRVTGLADEAGLLVLELWPNERGTRGTAYAISATAGNFNLLPGAVISVPDGEEGVAVDFASLLNVAPYPAIDAAQQAVAAAQAAAVAATQAALATNIDGGTPSSIYGGIPIIDAGAP